eukprot:10176095-Heterocapsa_arctica.AAC.1
MPRSSAKLACAHRRRLRRQHRHQGVPTQRRRTELLARDPQRDREHLERGGSDGRRGRPPATRR